MDQLINELEQAISPLVTAEGANLYACQFTQEDGVPSLHIMIDQEGGVNIQTCADLSRTIGLMMQVDFPKIPEKYQLMVTSPGIERPLLKLEHYQQVLNKNISVQLVKAFENKKRYKGELIAIDDNQSIQLKTELGDYTFSIHDIAKAKLLWDLKGAKK